MVAVLCPDNGTGVGGDSIHHDSMRVVFRQVGSPDSGFVDMCLVYRYSAGNIPIILWDPISKNLTELNVVVCSLNLHDSLYFCRSQDVIVYPIDNL